MTAPRLSLDDRPSAPGNGDGRPEGTTTPNPDRPHSDRPRVVAFGEILLRLDPPERQRLVQADTFEVRFTGAEANVAAALAQFGFDARVAGAVPDDLIGDAALSFLRRFDVDTALITRKPGRLGLFYLESGGAGRPGRVIYDRGGSVFSRTGSASYDWQTMLEAADWLHISGTAVAVGKESAQAVSSCLDAAQAAGVGISLDLNYRSQLWTPGEAGAALAPILESVDVLLGAGEDAVTVLGVADPRLTSGRRDRPMNVAERQDLAEATRLRYGLSAVAETLRQHDDRGHLQLRGLLVDSSGRWTSRPYPIVDRIGRLGTGDAFAAGILRGLLLAKPSQDTIDFAAAAAYLKQSVRGDVLLASVSEVQAAREGVGDDEIRR
jgi:2-dehydro-3-deoxygluconokinase